MLKYLLATALLLASELFACAQNYCFGAPSSYNNSEYTHNIYCYPSIEAAMKAPADSVKALKVNASNKNMLQLKNFTHLKYILLDEGFVVGGFYLTRDALNAFFAICDQLPELQYIGINDSRLLPFVKSPERLKGLLISQCDYNTLQASLPKFVNLDILIVADSHVQFLPDIIGQMRSLRQLELYTPGLVALPSAENLSQLQVLRAEVGKIVALPPSYAALKQVKDVSITGLVNFKKFPQELSKMNSLEVLEIELSDAKALPDSLGRLTSLKALYLKDCNRIEYLPKTFAGLSNLEYLYLSGCRNAIDVSVLSALKQGFTLKLVHCNYTAIAKQLQNVSTLKALWVPADILPSEVKKIEQYIPSDKIQKQEFIIH